MVEDAAGFVLDLAGGVLEGVFEWLAGGGSVERGEPDHAHDDAISRYAENLYEERRPPQQDLNR